MKGGKEGERSNYVLRTWKRNRKRKKARPLLPSLHARKSEITTFSFLSHPKEGGGGLSPLFPVLCKTKIPF